MPLDARGITGIQRTVGIRGDLLASGALARRPSSGRSFANAGPLSSARASQGSGENVQPSDRVFAIGTARDVLGDLFGLPVAQLTFSEEQQRFSVRTLHFHLAPTPLPSGE
jgi:hypothetical protein